jgi:hypothetical protein
VLDLHNLLTAKVSSKFFFSNLQQQPLQLKGLQAHFKVSGSFLKKIVVKEFDNNMVSKLISDSVKFLIFHLLDNMHIEVVFSLISLIVCRKSNKFVLTTWSATLNWFKNTIKFTRTIS